MHLALSWKWRREGGEEGDGVEGRILRRRDGVSRGVLGVKRKGMKETEGGKGRSPERARGCDAVCRHEDCRIIRGGRGAWRRPHG